MALVLEHWMETCLPKGVRILKTFHNHSIIALEKPSGVLSHPNPSKDARKHDKSLLNGSFNDKEECYSIKTSSSDPFKTYLLHRLDKATSGVILVATDKAIASQVKRLFKNREISKEYCAIILGQPLKLNHQRRNDGIWIDDYSTFSPGKRPLIHLQPRQQSSSKIAQTRVTHLQSFPNQHLSLIKMNPLTGFTHQLRYQAALRGSPILGDEIYGNFDFNKSLNTKRLFLHARAISFQLQIQDKDRGKTEIIDITAESSLPEDFSKFD